MVANPAPVTTPRAQRDWAPPLPPVVRPQAAPQLAVLEYVMLLGLGVFVLGYLACLCRASKLDEQATKMEAKLSEVRFETLQAKRDLVLAMTAAAATEDSQPNSAAAAWSGPVFRVPCPALPEIEPSPLASVAGCASAWPQRQTGEPSPWAAPPYQVAARSDVR